MDGQNVVVSFSDRVLYARVPAGRTLAGLEKFGFSKQWPKKLFDAFFVTNQNIAVFILNIVTYFEVLSNKKLFVTDIE